MARTKRVLTIGLLALAFVLLLPQAAMAASECLECHSATTDFTASSVDYSRCRTCHWVASHPAHNTTDQCNACHAAWPSRQVSGRSFSSKTSTAYGYFDSQASLSTTSSSLHELHARGSWPDGYSYTGGSSSQRWVCGSCHAPASCTACHAPVPHGTHPGAAYPAVGRTETSGTPSGVKDTDTRAFASDSCINSSCHDVEVFAPSIADTLYEDSGAAKTGTWRTLYSGLASGSYYAYSTTRGSTITFSFSGPGTARLLARTTASSGYADLKLDGVSQPRIDLYSPSPKEQQVSFTSSALGSGSHTLQVTIAYAKRAASTGYAVAIDAVKVTADMPAAKPFKPVCNSCHAATHGTGRTMCYSCHGSALRSYPGSPTVDPTKHMQVTSSTRALTAYPGADTVSTPCNWCHTSHYSTRATGATLCSACHDAGGLSYPGIYSYQGGTRYAASTHSGLGAASCEACHAPHGKPNGSGGTIPALLKDAEEKTCTGSGDGTCHSSAANSASGSNIYSALRASTNNSTHHDITSAAQAATGARIACSDCHNPHADNRTAKSADPDNIATAVSSVSSDYFDSQGHMYALISAEHDGVPPVISGLYADNIANEFAPVIKWSTNEPATTYVEYGPTTAYGTTLGNGTLATSHSVQMPSMAGGTVLHWRAVTTDAVGNAAYSADQVYAAPLIVMSPPTIFDALDVSYDDGSGAINTLQWAPMTAPDGDPVEYQVEYGPSPNPAVYRYGWQTEPFFVGNFFGGTFMWHVRVRDKVHPERQSLWSSTDTFTCTDNTPSSSCPFLFTWDGTGYRFEGDVMMPGKMANKVATGYQTPNPQDAYRLETSPATESGLWKFRLVEERYEVDYMDRLQLFAADAPLGYEVIAEKPGVGGTVKEVRAQLHTVKDPLPPVSATHLNSGTDVLSKLAEHDGDFLVLNDSREDFTYQTIELDLGDVSRASQLKLVFSAVSAFFQTEEGVANSGKYGPRTKIEMQKADGTWASVPASDVFMPVPPEFERTYVVDVTKALAYGGPKMRLTFLYKTYIDMLKVDKSVDQPITLTEAPLVKADLRHHGVDGKDNLNPDLYSYVYGDPNDTAMFFPGSYTKYGSVLPLLAEKDDKFAIFGGGDEMDLEFRALQEAAPGLSRELILGTYGFYKDTKNDLAHTVDPLPFSAMSNYPYPDTESYPTDADHQAYRDTWNTRVDGLTDTSAASLASHYSANTDRLQVMVDSATGPSAYSPAAAWQTSAVTRPTPLSPGTPVAGTEIAKVGNPADNVYWVTDLAATDRAVNYQLARFDLPASGVRSSVLIWKGHGEPSSGYSTSFALWNFRTGTWDVKYSWTPLGGDTTVSMRFDTVSSASSTSCLRCHDAAPPSGVVFPAGTISAYNIATVWGINKHGTATGAGFGGGLLGFSRGQAALPCASCHDPHGNSNPNHIVKSNGGISITIGTGNDYKNLCSGCHTGTVSDWHASCTSCHDAYGEHEAYGPIPAVSDTADCSSCHKHNQTWTHNPTDPSGPSCDGYHCTPPSYAKTAF